MYIDEKISTLTTEIKVEVPVEHAWKIWTTPSDIMQWNIPFDDWHCPVVENDITAGGKFLFRMEAKGGNDGFDHAGTYDTVVPHQLIEYTGNDGRTAHIQFTSIGKATTITETFQPEQNTPIELQKDFCQSVLDKFKRYAEEKYK